jgi:hypothetical protein
MRDREALPSPDFLPVSVALESEECGHCGLVERRSACRCAKLVGPAIELGIVDAERLRYVPRQQAESLRRDIDDFTSAAELFRSHSTYTFAMRELVDHKFGADAG